MHEIYMHDIVLTFKQIHNDNITANTAAILAIKVTTTEDTIVAVVLRMPTCREIKI